MSTAWLLPIVPLLTALALFAAAGGALRARIDLAAACFTGLVAAGLLVWPEDATAFLRPDRLSLVAALIACTVAALARWQGLRRTRRADVRRIGGQVTLGGVLLTMLAADPVSRWIGMAIAAAAFLATRPARERAEAGALAAAGLCLTLFGVVAAGSGPPLLAAGCLLLGIAVIVALVPALLPALPVLLLRFRGEAQAGVDGTLLLAIGLGAALACAWLAVVEPRSPRRGGWVALGHAGLGGVAVGLGSAEGTFAGAILLLLLPLAQAAVALASRDGMDRLAADAGLVGLPPLGLFPGLVMVVAAVGRQMPWLLPLVVLAIAAMGWSMVSRSMVSRSMVSRSMASPLAPRPAWGLFRASQAWIPIGIALLVGLALPRDVGAWLYAALPGSE